MKTLNVNHKLPMADDNLINVAINPWTISCFKNFQEEVFKNAEPEKWVYINNGTCLKGVWKEEGLHLNSYDENEDIIILDIFNYLNPVGPIEGFPSPYHIGHTYHNKMRLFCIGAVLIGIEHYEYFVLYKFKRKVIHEFLNSNFKAHEDLYETLKKIETNKKENKKFYDGILELKNISEMRSYYSKKFPQLDFIALELNETYTNVKIMAAA